MSGWLKIDENESNFILDGQKFFYLADTVWSAFTNITEKEWEYYLDVRKTQGFNTLQINTMPQWDRCRKDIEIYPFPSEDGSLFEFTEWNQEYYEKAKRMCKIAVEKGFQLALVVLWLNYVPGTWAGRVAISNEMPQSFVEEYTKKIVEEFDCFHPIYIISGDTDIDTPEAKEHYKIALDTVYKNSPNSLKCFHLKRGYSVIPEEFLDKIDFYMYQSGHNKKEQDMTYKMPAIFMKKYPKKPIINSEPCYEQMSYGVNEQDKFGIKDVRKAAWNSILSGAGAGITYGAHGIWNWQRDKEPAMPLVKQGFCTPQPWNQALQFPGAKEYGWICQFLKQIDAWNLTPMDYILEKVDEQIRIAKTYNENYLLYIPQSCDMKITLLQSLCGYKGKIIELEKKKEKEIGLTIKGQKTILEIPSALEDMLVILYQ